MGNPLILEHLGQSAILTLNRPPENLLTVDMLVSLVEQLATLQQDPSVRSVVIAGAGDISFSAGAFLAPLVDADVHRAEQVLDDYLHAFAAIRNFRGVTVAAVNGLALGAGLECALSCDYIVAERGAMLGMTQARLGLVPAAGGCKMLVDKVGLAWAKRMVLGGEVLDAETACRIGLVEEVVDPGLSKIVAVSLASKVAQQGPQAVAAAQQLLESCAGSGMDLHLQHSKQAFLGLIGSEEQRAGIAAFIGNHAPPWSDDPDD
jgi:enoyl-CoA hydratase/carnithine racemase